MYRSLCWFGLTVGFTSAIAHAAGMDTANDRKEIKSLVERVRVVFEKKQFDNLPVLCAAACKFKMDTGKWIGNVEMVENLKQYMQPIQELRISERITQIRITGSSADVRAEETTLGTVIDPHDKSKHSLRSDETNRYRLSKVRSKGALVWLLSSWESVSGKSYIDGKLQK